ncbi:MAG: FAD-dependent oxidoreductase [Alphaproteobacteria bacterium]|nr:FAD-dependent oxidoreductase [Alphaproteobacteria bacterium]
MNPNVVIIGGGLAGLCACRLLCAAGIEATVVEARGHLGGRILTVDENGQLSADGFDLGPSWYWPAMQPGIGRLVDELGLPAFVQHSAGDVVFERMSREPSQRYRSVVEGPPAMRLAGGSGALVRALIRAMPGARVFLNTRLREMALDGDEVKLTVTRGDGSEAVLTATQVIAAVPPRLLEASVKFTPVLDTLTVQRWRATPTWMAPHAKFFAVYDRPFWRDAGLSGTAQSMVGPMPEIHDATTASGQAALFGFVGIPADQRASLGEEELRRVCLGQLVRIYGAEARTPRATLLKDWAADPLTATLTDRIDMGHVAPDSTPWVTGVWQRNLVLGGSETSPVEPGYLAGAVEAARLAVARVLNEKVTSRHPQPQ